jgi:hypothetical protein
LKRFYRFRREPKKDLTAPVKYVALIPEKENPLRSLRLERPKGAGGRFLCFHGFIS